MKRLFIIFVLCSSSWATTYYLRADGSVTAANKANATGCGATTTAMNITQHNAATFAAGDTITLCDSGGDFTDGILTPPTSGSAGNVITYTNSGSPIINGANAVTSWTQGTGALAEEPCTGACIFDSGFETGGSGFTDWTSIEIYQATVTQSTTHVAHGTYAMAVTKTAGTGTKGLLHKTITAPAAGVPMYFRFYIYVPTGALGANLSNYLIWYNNINNPNLGIYTDGSGNITKMQFYAGGCAPCTTNVTFSMDAWHYIDLEFLLGTTTGNGGGQLWLDGNSIGSGFTYNTTALGFTDVDLGISYSTTVLNTSGVVYFDDFRMSTAGRIGTFSASGVPTNVWYGSVTTQPGVVEVNGAVSAAQSGYGSLTADQWYWAANVLYVGSTASPTDVQAAIRNYNLDLTGKSYITVNGIKFEYANLHDIVLTNGSYDTIQNSTITGAYANGLFSSNASGAVNYLTITGNTFTYNGACGLDVNSGNYHTSVTNNTAHHNSYNTSNAGPWFQYMAGLHSYDNTSTPNYIVFANNVSYSNGVVGGNANQGKGIWFDTLYNSTMEYNRAYSNAGDGIFLEANVNSAMIYNVTYSNATNQYSANINCYATNTNASGNLIANNTSNGSNWWGMELGVYTGATVTWSNNTVENNIVVGSSSYNVYFDHAAFNDGSYGTGNVYSHNAFGTAATSFLYGVVPGAMSTYAALDSAYGSSTNSVTTLPTFTNTGTGDFTLSPGSSAIHSGVNLGATYMAGLKPGSTWPSSVILFPQGADGTWDIGAYVWLGKHCVACEMSRLNWPALAIAVHGEEQ